MFDEKFLFGRLLNGAGNPLAVLWSEDQRAQDEQVQRALQELESFRAVWGRHLTRVLRLLG